MVSKNDGCNENQYSNVRRCDCKHEYQDKTYGKGRRLHNKMSANNQMNWKCTVCGEAKL